MLKARLMVMELVVITIVFRIVNVIELTCCGLLFATMPGTTPNIHLIFTTILSTISTSIILIWHKLVTAEIKSRLTPNTMFKNYPRWNIVNRE